MASQFSTMSTEMIDREIKKVEQKLKMGGTDQDKLMLFALRSEYDQRVSANNMSEEKKFLKFIDEYENVLSSFKKIDFTKIQSEHLVPTLMKFYHEQMEFSRKLNVMIEERNKVD